MLVCQFGVSLPPVCIYMVVCMSAASLYPYVSMSVRRQSVSICQYVSLPPVCIHMLICMSVCRQYVSICQYVSPPPVCIYMSVCVCLSSRYHPSVCFSSPSVSVFFIQYHLVTPIATSFKPRPLRAAGPHNFVLTPRRPYKFLNNIKFKLFIHLCLTGTFDCWWHFSVNVIRLWQLL